MRWLVGFQVNSRRGICRIILIEIGLNELSLSALEGDAICYLVLLSVGLICDVAFFRPVGSGKTALLLALCRGFRDEYNIGESSTQSFKMKFPPPEVAAYPSKAILSPLSIG